MPTASTPLEQQTEHLTKARDIAARAENESRDFTPEERVEIKAHIDAAADIKRKREDAAGDSALLDALKSMGDSEPIDPTAGAALNQQALSGARTGVTPAAVAKSTGQRFIESDEWKRFASNHPHGVSEKARVQMDPVHVGALKALLGPVELPGMVPVDHMAPAPVYWGRELSIRDLVTVGTTTGDVVEYARQLAATNNAAPVPTTLTDAADATPTTAEGFKPQSSFTFEKKTENVKTIAHWLAATKRSLSDIGQLRTLIDSFLRFGLEEELEDQMVSGAGTGENFSGILTVSGTTAQAYATSPIVTIRKAITKVMTVGRGRTTGVALHPTDDEALDLAVDGQSRFFGNGPFGAGPSTIWGYPRAVSEAIPAGTAIVADWRYAALWDREAATIAVSDSHADFFIRNLVAVLAELRAAFGVIRPAAFVIADLTP
jgi:hypothetical protein